MSVYKKFAGQTLIYGLTTIISRLFNFVLTPIYTRVYAEGIYGIFTKMFGYVSIINAILAFGMETTFFRYLNKHEDKKQEIYNTSFLVVAFVSLLFLLTGLIFTDNLARFTLGNDSLTSFADQKKYVQYFIWIIFIDAICTIPFAKIRADGKPLIYTVVKFVNIGSFVGLNLIFIYVFPSILKNSGTGHEWLSTWFRPGWIGYVFVSNLIATSTTFLLLLPQFLKLQIRFDRPLFKKMFEYSWPILVANLSFIINENLDKILLSKYLPPNIADHDTGIYGAVCKLAIFISIFNTAFRLGAEPFFFGHAKNANAKTTYANILNYYVLALAILFVGLVANIDILKHFIDHKFWVGLPAVPLLLFGYVCLGIYMNLSVWYRLSDQTRYGLYISMVGAVFTIIMNIILIPKYSYMGSAWVSMGAYFILMISSYLLGQKYYPIPYNLKKILAYLGVSLVLVYLSFFTFKQNIFIGNGLFAVFLITIYLFEKDQIVALMSTKQNEN